MANEMAQFTGEIRLRVEALLGSRVTSVVPVQGGYTAAGRWRVALEAGGTAFVKVGTTPHTCEAVRLERNVYGELKAPFMAKLLAWEDHSEQPLLVLEDLSGADWPPPWTPELIEAVRRTLDQLHASHADLKCFDEIHPGLGDGWLRVSQAPEPFESLGLATASWLRSALPLLIRASARVISRGNEVVHFDVRSDNLCNGPRGVVLLDWNWACLGNGDLDTGFWLPSLEAEGGPAPEAILPGRAEIAAYVSGYFAARAGLPPIPEAPHAREAQLQQLVPALRWAARELALPLPDSSA